MKNYLKLVNFELGRFLKIYAALAVITIISQISGLMILSKRYLKNADIAMYQEGMTQAEFLNSFGKFSLLDVTQSLWFIAPITLAVAGLILYLFLIWYRDWFGKNTFIYRLLMLPTNRMHIFFAKATSIMMMVIGLVSLQLILLVIESRLIILMVPKVFRVDIDIFEQIKLAAYLEILIPQTFTEFILYYGLGFMALSLIFTGILFERSYGVKGFILGVIYPSLIVGIMFLPTLIEETVPGGFFYMRELLLIEILLGIILTVLTLWISNYLLKHKITV